jgi:hypothetical protein
MKPILAILILLPILLLASCATPPMVTQGKVIQCDGVTVTVRNEAPPQDTLKFLLRGADIGAKPNPGDIVRIAYHTSDGEKIATRVMNISRQKDLKAGK